MCLLLQKTGKDPDGQIAFTLQTHDPLWVLLQLLQISFKVLAQSAKTSPHTGNQVYHFLPLSQYAKNHRLHASIFYINLKIARFCL